MKQLQLFAIIFFIFFSTLYAYDLSSYVIDKNMSEQDTNTSHIILEKPRKRSKSLYKKFEDLFSDYDDDWAENMLIYSMDMMMPDENILATKKVINNRIDEKFDAQTEQIPKILANDAYNMLLSTMYYHAQDLSRITDETWEEEVCDPDTFIYSANKDPKEPLLYLKENDEEARGITENGIVLPFNPNFPDAYYPYASRPDGCSAEGLQDVYDLANEFFNDDKWLQEACNEHDRCYYTVGMTSKECNNEFMVKTVNSCNNISGTETVVFMGTRNAICGMKALTISTAANACAEKYFAEAQRKQKAYLQWVINYEKAFNRAQRKAILKQ
ncbi:hypothetical protein TSL6_05210 [Sulfurovum sp. TSL6]|uniref:hypothetical protein n=1 Tax=Sulfurovum sp. TSL6 TaxID=2826995 RepID=UPI001CC6A277|nr:hypothetical protein [Sulfurovum sp. TSL6]GIU00015.1 hypothetical protein TSL6_05210 [Sulfurovum sp. TSL6]